MIDRSKCPEPTKEIDFTLHNIDHITLTNGMKVLFVKKDNLPIVQLSYLIGAGSKNDPEDKLGLSHLTAMMIDEGAGPFNSLEFDDEVEKIGSILSISNNHDAFYIAMLSLTENLHKSLELTSFILKNPHLKDEDFLRESTKLKNKLQQVYDDPGYVASTVFEKICYRNTQLSHPTMGTKSTLENVTLDDVKDFHKNLLTPDNTTLIVVGNVEKSILEGTLEELFSDWKGKRNHIQTAHNSVKQKSNIYIVDKPGATQSEIRLGHLTSERTSPDFFSKMVMNTILGGQFSSRINLNLREDKGFTYGANSMFSYYKNAGLFKVATAVNIENTSESLTEIIKEINGIRENVSDIEVEFAKSYLIKSFPSKFETYGQIANSINLLVIHDLEDDYFDNYIENISKVTKEDVLETARNNLYLDEMTIVIVGDKKTILPQLKDQDFEIITLDIEGNIV